MDKRDPARTPPQTRLPRGVRYDRSEDVGRNPSTRPSFEDILDARFGRRDLMRGALAATAVTATLGPIGLARSARADDQPPSFVFEDVPRGADQTHHVAPGYRADILIRWGDPVLPGAPAFDPLNQTAEAQEQQFGYNNDFIAYMPLPAGSDTPDHGLLVVNHEYTSEELMFPGMPAQDAEEVNFANMTRDIAEIEMAAHGLSVIEVRAEGGTWSVVGDSPHNRRLSMRSGVFTVGGPAAGHDRFKTAEDPEGMRIIGTLNNCAGGTTPWGTSLHGEENFHGYFWGEVPEGSPEAANHGRYGVPGGWYNWGAYFDRFDVSKEPNEPNRFGWIVEVDPYDPTSTPIKRTALGRMKHEGAGVIVNGDGRVVAYMGDDERYEYVYRFVTAGTFNPDDRAANMNLLDEGTLSVARFHDDGTVEWLPLVHGEGPLTAENGFNSQADVVIEARRAGDLVGATRMDRPEEVQPNSQTNKVYVMLTNNTRRKPEEVNGPNPRPANAYGQIVEITPPEGDHTADRMSWTILVRAGDPDNPAHAAMWNSATTANNWFGMPDNVAFDSLGRVWIGTDGMNSANAGCADGFWAIETEGQWRGTSKLFFRVPIGAENCGNQFNADSSALFIAVQHPGESGEEWPEFGRPSTFDDPSTRWPDFQDGMPPRPSIVVITREGGGTIGT